MTNNSGGHEIRKTQGVNNVDRLKLCDCVGDLVFPLSL